MTEDKTKMDGLLKELIRRIFKNDLMDILRPKTKLLVTSKVNYKNMLLLTGKDMRCKRVKKEVARTKV